MNQGRSLRSALLRRVIIPTGAVMLILLGVILLGANLIQRQIVEHQRVLIDALARQGDQYLSETERLMHALAYTLLALPPEGQRTLLAQVRAEYAPRFTALYLLDDTGRVLVEDTDAFTLLGLDMSGQSYFDHARQSSEVYFSAPFISLTTGQVAVTAAAPVLVADQFSGMLVGELNLELLQQTIEQVESGESSETFIVDQHGKLVAHPNPVSVQEQRNLGYLDLVQQGLAGELRQFGVFYDPYRDRWLIGSVNPMRCNWMVVTMQPIFVAARPLVILMGASLLAFGLSVLLFLGGQVYSMRQITRPISLLAQKADALSASDYDEALSLEDMGQFSELISLGRSFTQMVEAVARRTAELEAANTKLLREIAEREQMERALRESETRYRTLVETSPDAIVLADLEMNVLVCNQRAVVLFGFTSLEEVIGKNALDFIIPEDHLRVLESAQKALQAGSTRNVEYTFCRADGSHFVGELSTSVVWDAWEKPQSFIGVVRDITERKRLLTQVQAQAQRVQQIIDTVPEGVLLLGYEGRVALVNPVAERNLAILAQVGVGDILTALGDRILPELLTSPPKGLWHEVRANGHIFEVIARPMENDQEAGEWVLLLRDVTQEHEIQRRIRQQERLAAVGQLAAGIAHDFNNVMSTIVLYAQMAARAPNLSARDRERMNVIDGQARHASRLIQQILDFSRRGELEQRSLDLLPLVKEQVQILKRTLPESIQVELIYGRDKYVVNADPTRIQQVLMNLAVNARDAMPDGGTLHLGLARLDIEARKFAPLPEMAPGAWVVLTVSDTGQGIPPDILPRIYDPFFTTKAPGKGSGLGLSQVHGIVMRHAGHIDVQSKVGKGTTFTVYLPALLDQALESMTPVPESMARGEGERLLVVEDNAATREALIEGLELLNYSVIAAENGREALAILERQSKGIALVLSDVVMPDMGGIALLRAIRAQGLDIGVILVTGHSFERELKDLWSLGMVAWLPKPINLARLAEVVDHALKKA